MSKKKVTAKVKQRRKFTVEYQQEAVALVRERGLTIAQASQDLGLGKSTLEAWLRKYNNGLEVEPPLTVSERDELRKLRKDYQTVKMERDFLKKTAVFFARSVV